MSELLPSGAMAFLDQAGWGGDTAISPLDGDASARRYFRLGRGEDKAILMHAPPPDEDVRPFLKVAAYLEEQGIRSPTIHAADEELGFILQEDLGDIRVKELLEEQPDLEREAYRKAVDTLIELHTKPCGNLGPYDRAAYLREVDVFTEWFCPMADIEADTASFHAAWDEVLAPLLKRQGDGVTVLRDYHAENIMVMGVEHDQAVIDFQDALAGHKAYDLVSLLQDARRDVPEALEREMLNHYQKAVDTGPDFEADYAVLGAQRNTKIVGIFTRLAKRDGKERYLEMIPRVWRLLERDLAHPALHPVARWFDRNVPKTLRDNAGALDR